MKNHPRRYSTAAVALILICLAPFMIAADINHLRPPVNSMGLMQTNSPTPLAPGQWAATGWLTYAYNPLVYRYSDDTYTPVIAHQLILDASANVGLLPLFDAALSLPVILRQGGGDANASVTTASGSSTDGGGTGIGDLLLTLRFNPLPERVFGVGVTVAAELGFPTGNPQLLAGAGTVSVRPMLLLTGPVGPLQAFGSVAYWYRGKDPLDDTVLADSMELHLGARLPLWILQRGFVAMVEATANLPVRNPSVGAVDVEIFAGAGTRIAPAWDLTVGAAAGLSQGVGVPAARAIVGVSYRPSAPDRDHDGVPDSMDACPDQPEDYNGFADLDGCQDANDMPKPDRDHDGIPDDRDQCPDQAEDLDGVLDTDGCPDPDPDRDHDGIPDIRDKCPDQPEVFNGQEDTDGCPDEPPSDVEYKEKVGIDIKKTIQFEVGKAIIKAESFPVLDQVAAVLLAHLEVTLMRVEGHTDSVGPAESNLRLSQARAEAVRQYLMERGIAGDRLQAQGYGEERPIDTNDTPEGRAKNRRVEFIIVSQ